MDRCLVKNKQICTPPRFFHHKGLTRGLKNWAALPVIPQNRVPARNTALTVKEHTGIFLSDSKAIHGAIKVPIQIAIKIGFRCTRNSCGYCSSAQIHKQTNNPTRGVEYLAGVDAPCRWCGGSALQVGCADAGLRWEEPLKSWASPTSPSFWAFL